MMDTTTKRYLGPVLALLLVLALGWFATPASAQDRLAIVGGFLIDGNEGPPLANSVILVEGNRIVHVGTVDDTEIPAGATVIDARGHTVMPGLNDAHVHLMIVGHGVYDDYFPAYGSRYREIMPISARQLLEAGVTSARDLGAPLEDALWIKREIEEGRLPGPRLFVSGPFLQKSLPQARGTSYDSSIQAPFRWTVDGPDDARRKTRQLIEAGVDLIKVIQVTDMTSEERLAIRDEARRAGLHIAVHGGFVEDIRAVAEIGANSIEHVGERGFARFPDESVQLMAENNIYYSPTSVVSRIYDITNEFPARRFNPRLERDLPADLYRDVMESIEWPSRLSYFHGAKFDNHNHASKILQLHESGVRIVVGTDSGTPMNFHYEAMWQEMDLLVQYGIPPMRVISGATKLPALLYGVGRDLGTIEPGKFADIIVVDGNPLQHMSVLRHPVHVIKDGKVFR
jgi:imidazolonepropionase-like amidohydrolase